jgi:hypothetical protein
LICRVQCEKNPSDLVAKPIEFAIDTFILGADLIEAGLHKLGMDYNPVAQQRNHDRMEGLKDFWNADGLTQREAILTMGTNVLMFGGLARRTVPGVRDFRATTSAKPIDVAGAAEHSKFKPSTRKDLDKNLLERDFKFHSETPRDYNQGKGGGIVTYKGPDGRVVTIKDTGEVIMTQKKWTADGAGKYPERQDYFGNRLLDQSHSTGYFVEPYIGPHKPKGPGL